MHRSLHHPLLLPPTPCRREISISHSLSKETLKSLHCRETSIPKHESSVVACIEESREAMLTLQLTATISILLQIWFTITISKRRRFLFLFFHAHERGHDGGVCAPSSPRGGVLASQSVVCCSMVAVVHGELAEKRKKELDKKMSFLI